MRERKKHFYPIWGNLHRFGKPWFSQIWAGQFTIATPVFHRALDEAQIKDVGRDSGWQERISMANYICVALDIY